MDIPRRCFLTVDDQLVTAMDEAGNSLVGGLLKTDISDEKTSLTELITTLQENIILLKEQNIAFLLAKDCPSLRIARAAVFASRKGNLPLLVSMDSNEEGETPLGDQLASSLIALQELGIVGFGVGGSLPPDKLADLLDKLTPFSKIPLMATPTAGEPNPILPELYDLSPKKMTESILPILEQGVTILIQGDGVTEEHAKAVKETLFHYDHSAIQLEREDEEDHIILSTPRDFFVIHDERLEVTEPLLCSHDMADELIAAEDENYDVLLVRIETPDDAITFADNAHLAALPVMFSSDNEISLKSALMLYDGRAMIDSESAIKEEILQKIAEKYGSVLY